MMDWKKRVRSGGLALALLVVLGAAPAWAGAVRGSGTLTAKSGAQHTLLIDDQVTVKITPDTQLVDPAGNRLSFDSIPVSGSQNGQVIVDYEGSQSGSVVVADRVIVTQMTE